MSTETADIERMARDIFSEASHDYDWAIATQQRREFCIGMAKHLYQLGYKPSIVHECCVEAEAARSSKRACTCTIGDACSNCTDTPQAGIIEHAEILRYVVVRTSAEGTSIVDLGFGADDRAQERAEASARNLNNIGPYTGFQVAIITALPQDGES